jgi:hypothetical protein
MQLDWLSEYNYQRCLDRPGGVDVWICRDSSARLDSRVRPELVVTAAGMSEGDDFVELSAALHDDNLCHVEASIDKIRTQDLRLRLMWYESRILAMLELGLGVNPGARPTARAKNPPCPACGAELRTPVAQQCFKCGADWHPRGASGIT